MAELVNPEPGSAEAYEQQARTALAAVGASPNSDRAGAAQAAALLAISKRLEETNAVLDLLRRAVLEGK